MSDLPKRKQIRLENYDYSQNGYYFVTICTYDRQQILSSVRRGGRPCPPVAKTEQNQFDIDIGAIIELSLIGKIVEKCWKEINKIYPNVETDSYVIMPDHFHGIIVIKDDLSGGQSRPPLPKVVQGFKSVTTRMCFEYGYKKIWQRGYYEHVIRNETDYLETVEYILGNPLRWELRKNE